MYTSLSLSLFLSLSLYTYIFIDAVGNPHRAQTSQFELFELIFLSNLYTQLPVEQFEATVSQFSRFLGLGSGFPIPWVKLLGLPPKGQGPDVWESFV